MAKFAQAAQKQSKDAQAGKEGHRYSVVSTRNAPSSQQWKFGFRYFQEIEFFGLDSSSIKSNWLVSVIERFSQLGQTTVDDVIGDKRNADANRCHLINWEQKNIPIQPEDLSWIPERFRNNEEFPLLQFAVSKAMGRVIGFFDDEWTFQLVLLDPLHNAQPTKDYGYKVNLCLPLGCELTTLRRRVEDAANGSSDCSCGVSSRLLGILDQPGQGTAMVICVSRDDLPEQLDELLQSKLANGIQDVLAAGVDAILAR